MPLETATYVSDLNASAPAHSDGLNQADAHMRLIKAALKSTFAHTGKLTNADNQLIPADGTATKPAFSFASEPTLGFYRMAAGVIGIVGGKFKGGVATGVVQMFLTASPLLSLGTATAHTGKDYLELNGATYNRVDYPDLADFMNGVGVGTTFTLPDMYTLGRFPRSRTAAVAAMTTQANTVGPHTHPDVTATSGTESADHTHNASGTTTIESNDHSHGYTAPSVNSSTGGGAFATVGSGTGASTGGVSAHHTHSFVVTTGGRSAAHTHNVTVSTPANTGTTETRPEAIAFVFAVKT